MKKKRARRKNPRASDQGAFFSVTMTRADVDAFKRRWPASGLPSRAITFQFDKRNGDLVDMWPDTSRFDGPALAALADDAQAWHASRRRNPSLQVVLPNGRFMKTTVKRPKGWRKPAWLRVSARPKRVTAAEATDLWLPFRRLPRLATAHRPRCDWVVSRGPAGERNPSAAYSARRLLDIWRAIEVSARTRAPRVGVVFRRSGKKGAPGTIARKARSVRDNPAVRGRDRAVRGGQRVSGLRIVSRAEASSFPGFAANLALFKKFHGRNPTHFTRVRLEDGHSGVRRRAVVMVGEAPALEYRTWRYMNSAKSHTKDGRRIVWRHKLGEAGGRAPYLVHDAVSGVTSLLGGTYRVAGRPAFYHN